MQKLIRSMSSFSWALPVFGADQALQLAGNPIPETQHPVLSGLDAVAHTAERELQSYFRGVFAAGDQLQRSVVDLTFGVMLLQTRSPQRLLEQSADVLRYSIEAAQRLIPGSEPAGRPCGWGEMPPVR
jgi:hypothetical protein